MTSKLAKYCQKDFYLFDTSTAYPLKEISYTGKQGTTQEVNQGEGVVKNLVGNYKGSCQNITTYKFFRTLSLEETPLS